MDKLWSTFVIEVNLSLAFKWMGDEVSQLFYNSRHFRQVDVTKSGLVRTFLKGSAGFLFNQTVLRISTYSNTNTNICTPGTGTLSAAKPCSRRSCPTSPGGPTCGPSTWTSSSRLATPRPPGRSTGGSWTMTDVYLLAVDIIFTFYCNRNFYLVYVPAICN